MPQTLGPVPFLRRRIAPVCEKGIRQGLGSVIEMLQPRAHIARRSSLGMDPKVLPIFSIRTSEVVKRKRAGMRSAWLRPLMKILDSTPMRHLPVISQ